MDYLDYTNEDKWDLEQLCMASLARKSQPLGMLYCDLVDGKHVFHKFAERRYLTNGPWLVLRVREEKKKLSQALRRLVRRKLVESYTDPYGESCWRLTWKGMDAFAHTKLAQNMQMEQPQDPEVNDY